MNEKENEMLSKENNSKLDFNNRYGEEWNNLRNFYELNNLENLRNLAFGGNLKTSHFRSIYWSLMLRVISDEPIEWIKQKTQQRERYEDLKKEFIRNPRILENKDDNPLSQSNQSVWNQYFSDQELFSIIKQDVVRTFPGVEFFHKEFVQETMTKILFYYARVHPYMCYRQGMHEILAPILFVVYSDHQTFLHYKETAGTIDEILENILNPDYFEADSYSIFSRLMSLIEPYYRIANMVPTLGGHFPSINESTLELNTSYSSETEIITHLNMIKNKILAKQDLHLHNYLIKMDIPLHIFGIRWLRLLFGREFQIQDLLIIWDAIFADSDKFELPDYIVVAMLIRIRDKLLLNDYTTCLSYLMRYPNDIDVTLILNHALHMQYPQIYMCPPKAFIYVTKTLDSKKTTSSYKINKDMKTNNFFNRRNKSKSFSSKGNNINRDDMLSRYKRELKKYEIANSTGSIPGVIDGFTENGPDLLRLELHHAQTIITISKTKLENYLQILGKYIPKNSPDELNQCLHGIEQLCDFLNVNLVNIKKLSSPVDLAFEVNEPKDKKNNLYKDNNKNNNNNNSNKIARTEYYQNEKTKMDGKKEFLKQFKIEQSTGDSDLSDDWDILGIDLAINTNSIEPIQYEKPDHTYSGKSFNIIGVKKDIELLFIRIPKESVGQNSGIPVVDPLNLYAS